MNKTLLKLIITLLLSFTLIFSLTSCGVIDSIFGGSSVSQTDDDDDDDDDKKKSNNKNGSSSDNQETSDDIITAIDRACVAASMLERCIPNEGGTEAASYTLATLNTDIETVVSSYAEYLTNELGVEFKHETLDVDADSETEAFFMINGFDYDWAGKFTVANDGFRLDKGAFRGDGLLIIYCNTTGSQTVIESFYREAVAFTTNVKANFDNGIFNLYPDGTTATHLAFPLNGYTDEPAELYKKALEIEGFDDIKYFSADISDAEESEYIFTYTKGNDKYITLFACVNGKMIKFYSVPEDVLHEKAVYTVQNDSGYYMLEYLQEDGYCEYSVYKFDASYNYIAKESYDTDYSDFYDMLNGYLSSAIACSNIYGTVDTRETIDNGFASMTVIGDFEFKNSAMVDTGTVQVPTFLYLRSGPGKSYSQVLTDYYNAESYVKLTDGMVVDILGYANTGDDENPVWLEVLVTYNGEKYQGYCSKEWVKFEGVASLHIGDTYNLNTTTDDLALTWKCSDTSIASVDSEGVVTGIRKGMVIVTATTSTGKEISCYAIVC